MSEGPNPEMVRAHNRAAWDRLVSKQSGFTRPADDQTVRENLATVDPLGWLGGDVRGKRILCLAAGGGRQGPIYAAAGGVVTVVDISPAMLELDRVVARERGLNLRTVETSMDDLRGFEPAEFDVVIHPVATCYVPDIHQVYRSVARVLAPGGIYVSQHKTPTSLQASIKPKGSAYTLDEPYYRTGPLPEVAGSRLREEGCWEFLHRWEELIGGLCRAGFVIEDLVEPFHAKPDAEPGSFAHRASFVAPYVRIKAKRIGRSDPESAARPSLWIPET